MFNSMKNQFREKTGKDVPKFTPQKGGLSRQSRQGSESSVCSLVLDTQQPSPSVQDLHQLKLPDGKVLTNKDVNLLAKKEEEWRLRFEKKETEWAKKLEKREAEIHNEWASKEEAWKKTEQSLTEDLLKHTNELKDALKTAEDFKRKVAQYQEERDTLEGFQTQEISKIKHLLLAKEKECSELSSNLKETTSLVESLKSEVSRLRPFEEQVSNFQVGRLSRQAGEEGAERRSAEAKVSELEAKLEEEVKEREVLSGRVIKLSEECATLANDLKAANNLVTSKDEDISELSKKIHDLEAVCEVLRSKKRDLQLRCDDEMEKARKLEEEIEHLSNGIGALSEDKLRLENELRIEKEKWKATDDELARERSAKDESLLRNAQISQEVNMAQQNLRQQQTELDELLKKVSVLEQDMILKEEALSQSETRTAAATKELQDKLNYVQDELELKKANEEVERGLRAKIADLEEQTTEKNKTIRVLQQKLSDVKKTLQREFKTSDNGTAEIIPNHTANHVNNMSIVKPHSNPDTEVSHLYMKNVIMKFLTSREYEVALHLTKAVATLLKLSHEEETLLKDTVTWRMSWFRTKPRPEDYIHS